ncbi:DUF6308 family protein [Kribbella sp. NPDC051952]|uniref:DUF6308 family protein n=1 Tax=Kribbella sp. NPDC051952 TaxID=3154851 RepID=UPI0034133797
MRGSMELPSLVDVGRRADAVRVLSCYYGLNGHEAHRYAGARFDTWDSAGTRGSSHNRFTADDLVAVSFLSVSVPPLAAEALLDTLADDFAELLEELGPDRDLVEERTPWAEDWVGWRLWGMLDALPSVGPTTASKLYARKRPRLRPIYDSVIAEVIGSNRWWEPLRAHLQQDPGLHPHLLSLRDDLKVPFDLSALRILDVLLWMHGKNNTTCTLT